MKTYTTYTIAEIKLANMAAGYGFFSRANMRAEARTMRDLRIIQAAREGDRVFLEHRQTGERWLFDPESGHISPIIMIDTLPPNQCEMCGRRFWRMEEEDPGRFCSRRCRKAHERDLRDSFGG